MSWAVRTEGLGKRYSLQPRARYRALRDSIEQAIRRPLALLRGVHPPASIWALRDVTFDVARGSVVGIVGRNGSGKTTLLRILSRITRPTSGRAEIRGRAGSLLDVGTGFHPELTGTENVYLSGAILGMRRAEIVAKFDEIVAFSGVEAFLGEPLKHYSAGMQFRLAFAVAAHLEPEVLFVDEVLAVGDLEFQRRCMGKMEEVTRAGRTILLVSHQLSQIRRLCERCLWLDAGSVRQLGPTVEVVAAYERALLAGPDPSAAGSGAAAEFVGWELGEGATSLGHTVQEHGPVSFVVRLSIRTAIEHGEYRIALYDIEQRRVWSTACDALRLEPGTHRIVHRLPSLPLRPGTYTWQASVFDGHVWEHWHAHPDLVLATSFLTYQRYDDLMGLLNIPVEVDITRLADPPGS